MRYILLFWALPMGIFWGWFALSHYDINFGLPFLTRQAHDFAFAFYGHILNIDPQTIPPLVARACVLDTVLIFAIYAFRRRRDILDWWREKAAGQAAVSRALPAADPVPPGE